MTENNSATPTATEAPSQAQAPSAGVSDAALSAVANGSELPAPGLLTGAAKRAATLAKLGIDAGTKMAGVDARPSMPIGVKDTTAVDTSEDETAQGQGVALGSDEDTTDIQIGADNNQPDQLAAEDQKSRERELRRQHLLIQKQNRQASEQMKQVRAEQQSLQAERERMARLDGAKQQWEQDPTAILREAGLDPNLYGQKLMRHFVELDKPVDPVQQKVNETVAPYIQELERQRQEIHHQQLQVTEANVMASQVRPILASNPDAFETLIGVHNGDVNSATVQVYNACKQIFIETGEQRSFQEVAELIENNLSEQVDLSLKRAMSMKKYRSRFNESGLNASPDARTDKKTSMPGNQAKPRSPATLTNNNNVSVSQPRIIVKAPTLTNHPNSGEVYQQAKQLDRVAETLAKHGLDSNGRKRTGVK